MSNFTAARRHGGTGVELVATMMAVAGAASSAGAQPLKAEELGWVSGEIVVFPTDLETGRRLRDQFIQERFTIFGFAPISGMMIVAVEPGLEDATIQYFQIQEGVRMAERSRSGRLGTCPGLTPPTNDPDFAMQWHLQNTEQVIEEFGQTSPLTGTCGADIDAVRGWERTRGSSDVWVAVFDTGIDPNNSEFEGRFAPEEDWISLSCAEIGGNPPVASTCCCIDGDCDYGLAFDVVGHGTWVTGTLAANHDGMGGLGVDPGCTILPVRVIANDDGILARSIIALELIDANNGANETYEKVRVINMSFLPLLHFGMTVKRPRSGPPSHHFERKE